MAPTPDSTPAVELSEGDPIEAVAPERVSGPLASAEARLDSEFWSRVHYSQPGDGSLWARGRSYKASFDTLGATYIPNLGAEAPRNYPVRFSLEAVFVDGFELPMDSEGRVRRDGNRVTLERGSVSEHYALELESVEQFFEIHELPRNGEIVIRIAVTSESEGIEDGEGFAFGNELGGVRYGHAAALTSSGDAWPLATELSQDRIEIRLPADFVAEADLPIVVDPLITTYTMSGSGFGHLHESNPDVAYDDIFGLSAYVWEIYFSANDGDVISAMVDSDGEIVPGSIGWIDTTSTDWTRPRIAANRSSDTFLVVASAGQAGRRDIYGGIRNRFNVSGSQFSIETHGSQDLRNPDVGGDPKTGSAADFCVVWERVWNEGSDHDVHAQLVDGDGDLVGQKIFVDNTTAMDHYPQISNSNGDHLDANQRWTIVWRRLQSGQGDIYGAQLDRNGSLQTSVFPIESSSLSSHWPSVSTMLDHGWGRSTYVVTFDHRRLNGNVDVAARAMQAGAPLTPVTYLSNSGSWAGRASVDSDGSSFVVAYSRSFGSDLDDPIRVYARTYELEDSSLVAVENLVELGASFLQVQPDVKVAAVRSGGGPTAGFLLAWKRRSLFAQATVDIHGARWASPGLGRAYGTATVNSSGQRASISAHGSRSLSRAQWSLQVNGAPSGQAGLFFFADGQLDVPFGEGRRLVGSSRTVRMYPIVTTNSSGRASIQPSPSSNWYADLIPGPTNMNYQFWFRDPGHDANGDGFAAGFNLSNAVTLEHTP